MLASDLIILMFFIIVGFYVFYKKLVVQNYKMELLRIQVEYSLMYETMIENEQTNKKTDLAYINLNKIVETLLFSADKITLFKLLLSKFSSDRENKTVIEDVINEILLTDFKVMIPKFERCNLIFLKLQSPFIYFFLFLFTNVLHIIRTKFDFAKELFNYEIKDLELQTIWNI